MRTQAEAINVLKSKSSQSHAGSLYPKIPPRQRPRASLPPIRSPLPAPHRIELTRRSQASRFYSTDKSVLRNHRCQGYATYPSMGFVPLQGTQHPAVPVSITDATSPLQCRSAERALASRPPLAQDNPCSTYFAESENSDGSSQRAQRAIWRSLPKQFTTK